MVIVCTKLTVVLSPALCVLLCLLAKLSYWRAERSAVAAVAQVCGGPGRDPDTSHTALVTAQQAAWSVTDIHGRWHRVAISLSL